MKFVTLRVPKISDSPAATRNSSMPLIRPPVACVMTQDAEPKHDRSACKSKIYPETESDQKNAAQSAPRHRLYEESAYA